MQIKAGRKTVSTRRVKLRWTAPTARGSRSALKQRPAAADAAAQRPLRRQQRDGAAQREAPDAAHPLGRVTGPPQRRKARGGLVDHFLALAEREAHERADALGLGAERRRGDGGDARALGQVAAERDAVVVAQRARRRRSRSRCRPGAARETRALEPLHSRSRLARSSAASARRLLRERQRRRGGVLERRAAREGHELLGAAHRARRAAAGPHAQPTFQPVTENVLPARTR